VCAQMGAAVQSSDSNTTGQAARCNAPCMRDAVLRNASIVGLSRSLVMMRSRVLMVLSSASAIAALRSCSSNARNSCSSLATA
jgi:hypothetical protein